MHSPASMLLLKPLVGDARLSVVGRGWLAGDTDGLAGWSVTVGVVEVGVVDTRYRVGQPGADAERYRCACLHCTQRLAGRGDGYQCCVDCAGVLVSYETR